MDKFTHLSDFLAYLFEDDRTIEKARNIITGILQAHSCRLSDIAREMAGNESANYKCIQRFVAKTALNSSLLHLYREEAQFLIGDPTEMPRPEAKKIDYVGTLSDGQTSGYWLLVLATPYQGRAIPCHFVSYSSAIIGSEATSRNAISHAIGVTHTTPGCPAHVTSNTITSHGANWRSGTSTMTRRSSLVEDEGGDDIGL